jgi:hypothetical protein
VTHTLHRQGSRESLERDYVVLAIPAKGINSAGSGENLQKAKEIMARHSPVNMGDLKIGNKYAHGRERVLTPPTEDGTVVHAVYRDLDTLARVLDDLRRAGTGLSVVVSGLFDHVAECCRQTGLEVHTTEFSLGVHGKIMLLPEPQILEVTTMCGHGMVGAELVRQMVGNVRRGSMTPRRASEELARQCVCGIMNPGRAAELIVKMACSAP